jgi:hypothetical protein
MRSLRIVASLVALTSSVVLAPSPCFAQTAQEKAGAREAAEAGAEAFDAGKYEQAIDLFKRAESVVHATPHLLYLARAYAHLNQLVQARESYLAIVSEPPAVNAHQVLKDTYNAAEAELDKLEPRVPRVTIVVQGEGGNGVQVTVDDAPFPAALLGVPQPINPGSHQFKATADGAESSPTTLEVREGARETVMLTLRAGDGKPVSASPSGATKSSGGDVAADTGGTSTRSIVAYSALGVGAIGVGLGTLFLVQRGGAQGDADDLYDACKARMGGCTGDERAAIGDKDDEAQSKLVLSLVSYGVGAIGLGTGITLLLLDSDEPGSGASETARPGVRPWIGLGSVGLNGRF